MKVLKEISRERIMSKLPSPYFPAKIAYSAVFSSLHKCLYIDMLMFIQKRKCVNTNLTADFLYGRCFWAFDICIFVNMYLCQYVSLSICISVDMYLCKYVYLPICSAHSCRKMYFYWMSALHFLRKLRYRLRFSEKSTKQKGCPEIIFYTCWSN